MGIVCQFSGCYGKCVGDSVGWVGACLGYYVLVCRVQVQGGTP